MNGSEIAIIGMACRFPGAKDVDELWQNLRDGVESVAFFSDEELVSVGVHPDMLTDPNYVRARAILEDVEWFDASFFGYSPREAEIMDPQHRLFLEEAWKAFEHAGYNPETYKGLISVYAGAGMSTYLLNNLSSHFDRLDSAANYQLMIGNNRDFVPTRVSYKLNLQGSSVNVQTACSTSLVAVHLACQSLLEGECDIVLAGGVSVYVPQKSGYTFQEGMILSPDGHCRAFDARAHGTVSGNGVGGVVLKRLETAIADGDCIHAVIKGSAINNDGSLKAGYTAPSTTGQARVILEAQAVSEVEPETITYIETHGTGTVLGDPIEIEALTQAFRAGTDKKRFCAIGSVKTNVGHLDAAAGVAGLIKTILALKHKLLPPSLHFEQPNPKIDFANSPFYVNATLSEWRTNGVPRRAGVSSFGIGGTNAHVILEEFETGNWKLETGNWKLETGNSRSDQLIVISAKTETALETATTNLVEYLRQHPEVNLADVAYTLQVGRKAFSHRRMLVCRDSHETVTALDTLDPKRVLTEVLASEKKSVAFMFPGQGAQYVNMARGLYEGEPTFREQVDRCAELLKPLMGFDLRHVLYPERPPNTGRAVKFSASVRGEPVEPHQKSALRQAQGERYDPDIPENLTALPNTGSLRESISQKIPLPWWEGLGEGGNADVLKTPEVPIHPLLTSPIKGEGTALGNTSESAGGTPAFPGLNQTAITQPALFVIEYALAKLWMEWGVRPHALIGHSVGEYVAACLAGVFSLEDALTLVIKRAQLMQQLPDGAMLTVPLSETEVQPLLGQELSLAGVNGSSLCVVSGRTEAIEALQHWLAEKGIACIRLHTSHAFHSAMMDPILEPFSEQVKKINLNPPQIRWVSTVTTDWITPEEATDPDYWVRNLRETVRFAQGVQQLLQDSSYILLEVGPGQTLSTLCKRHPEKAVDQIMLSSLRHPQDHQPDTAFLLNMLGRLWLAGVEVDWVGFYTHEQRHRVPLPTYPFERQRYWIESRNQPPETETWSDREEDLTRIEKNTDKRKIQGDKISKKPDIADWFYAPSWKRAVRSEACSEVECGSWLMFLDECGLGSRLKERLEQAGQDVVTVKAGSAFSKLSEREYTLNPRQRQDYDTLFDELCELDKLPNTIVHLWSVTENTYTESEFEQSQDRGLYSLLFLAQALGKRENPTDRKELEHKKENTFTNRDASDNIRIVVVSNGIQEVTGEELLSPGKATVLGPVKVIPQEYPNLRCCNIDVVLPGSAGVSPALVANRISALPGKEDRIPERLIDQLFVELTVKSSDPIIAYRGNYRWIQTFESVRLETGNWELGTRNSLPAPRTPHPAPRLNTVDLRSYPFALSLSKGDYTWFDRLTTNGKSLKSIVLAPRLRKEGVYLITGGLGEIGLVLAEYLAKTVRAKLILTGRSAFPARNEREQWLAAHDEDDLISHKIRKLQAIEELQAEVLVFNADVADQEQMENVIAQAEEQFGPISGVIHAAGITGEKSFHSLAETGKTECDQQFQPKIHGLIVLERVLQGKELDFCILCSCLSSVLGGLGLTAYSAANLFMDVFVHWHNQTNLVPWMSVNWDAWQIGAEKTQNAIAGTSLAKLAITPEEGVEAFQRILFWTQGSQVTISTGDLQTRIDQWIKGGFSPDRGDFRQEGSSSSHSRPDLPNPYTAPRNQLEQTLTDIWQQVLGVEHIGIHDNFFDLGGDSLVITQAISRVNKIFRLDLPPRSLFEKPTVAGLADRIETIRWITQVRQTSPESGQEEGEI